MTGAIAVQEAGADYEVGRRRPPRPMGRPTRRKREPAPGVTLAGSERCDLIRLVGEPASDIAAEDRDDADEQHSDEGDEETVFGHGNRGVVAEEAADGGAGHWRASGAGSVTKYTKRRLDGRTRNILPSWLGPK